MYKYRCLKCGYEEWAPAFVVDEIGYMDEVLQDDSECKKKGMPVLLCPCCNADFYFTGDSEKQ
ncbi:hypothetical protein KQI16_07135 [Caproiciproducens sp. MSJ-32]|nr:hypothetical protein [Caproiciproducens sp. MSJ-32]